MFFNNDANEEQNINLIIVSSQMSAWSKAIKQELECTVP